MLNFIDKYLDRITMYRLVLYVLIGLLGVAVIFSALDFLHFNPLALIYSVLVLLVFNWLANFLFAKFFRVPANFESVYITALILALIVTPPSSGEYISFLPFYGLLAIAAMGSKYLINVGKKHLFNPAAFAVFAIALVTSHSATWWVGTSVMTGFVFVGGFLLARKLRQFDLVIAFLLAFVVGTVVITFGSGNVLTILYNSVILSSLLFFAGIMLTEPLTMPPNRDGRIAYAILVGALFIPQAKFGSFSLTPEMALLVGNLFAYIVSPKGRHVFTLERIQKAGDSAYDFVFKSDKPFAFKAGQYLEWTLGQKKTDSRGNRRYFTIASSPTENKTILGVKFYENPSTFKQTLLSMQPGESLVGSQLAGDFVLPPNRKQKLVFIAGGIGVTPFRSMVKYLMDTKEKRDITLMYSNKTVDEVAYWRLFDEAKTKIGLKTVYTLTDVAPTDWEGYKGIINKEMILAEVPDFKERVFYISGSHGMVTAFKKMLRELGVARKNIKTDFFPGLA